METALKLPTEEEIQKAQEREPRHLRASNLWAGDSRRNVFVGKVEIGTAIEDILVPEYWSFHAPNLQPWDRIELQWEDMTRYVEVMVLDCAKTWAKVYILREEQIAKNVLKEECDVAVVRILASHEVIHRGPRRWSVVRKSDGAVIKEDMNLKDDAEDWLKRYAYGDRGAR